MFESDKNRDKLIEIDIYWSTLSSMVDHNFKNSLVILWKIYNILNHIVLTILLMFNL